MLFSRVESKQLEGDLWVVALHGEHDLSTSPSLDDTLNYIERTSGTTIVIDLTPVEFIDSTVLRAIVRYHAAGEQIELVAPPETFPRRLLRLLCIDERIPLHDTRDDALCAVRAARMRPARQPAALD